MATSKARELVLIVLPKLEERSRRSIEGMAAQLREKGQELTLLSAEQFGHGRGTAVAVCSP